MKFKFFWLTGD